MTSPIDTLGSAQYVLLTTYRKDGRSVPTPVWIGRDGDRLVVWTAPDAGKVKRIRRDGTVSIAPCDFRGNVRGDAVTGQARLLDRPETGRALGIIARKYGVLGRLSILGGRIRRGRDGQAAIAITLD
jgi:PPOX class probable F420-dependent enzyme